MRSFDVVFDIIPQANNRNDGGLKRHGGSRWVEIMIENMVKIITPIEMWDEIIYPFPNFNGAAVEVWNG